MIGEDLYRELGLCKEVSVVTKGVDNCIEFFVGAVPSFFTVFELVVEEEEGSPRPIRALLFHHAGIGDVGCVGGETDRELRIEGREKNVIADGGKEGVEGLLFFSIGRPGPRGVLLKEVVEAGNSVGIVGNEFVVETEHAKDGTEVVDTTRGLEITEGLDFVMGHADSFTTDDIEAEEIDFLSEPFTLMRFETQFIPCEGLEDLRDALLVKFERSFRKDDDIIEIGMAEDTEKGVKD